MMYILAKDQPLIFIMLTETDVKTMRPGRTVFLDLSQQAIENFKVSKVVVSLHKDADAIKDMLRTAGHGAALIDLVSAPHAESDEDTCTDCGGINKKYLLYLGKCIVCWSKRAMQNLRESN